MALSGIGDCTLCFETFSEEIRSRCLPCGHTFCTNCIEKLVKDRSLTCPTCKKIHICATGKEFPINYNLEETIIKCREMSLDINGTKQSTASDDMLQNPDMKMKPRAETIIYAQKVSSEVLLQESVELQSEFGEYRDFLNVEKAKHLELLQKIKKLAIHNEAAVVKFNEELSRLTSLSNDTNDHIRKLDEKLQNLKAAKSLTSSISAISDLEEPFSELENWNKQCRQKLPDAKIITTSKKVLTETTEALSVVDFDNEEPLEVPDFSHTTLTILEKKDKIWGYPTLNIEKLKSIAETRRGLLEKGLVYAVQSADGIVRSAQITTKDDKVYLHHLQEGEPPQCAHTIKHSSLMESLNTDSTVAFIDLTWDGILQGRIHILLSPDTPLARQFRILCTGDVGKTYARSKFHSLLYKNYDYEFIQAGDYEYSNGSGGASVLQELTTEVGSYTYSSAEGHVFAHNGTAMGPKHAQFTIMTGNCNGRHTQDFGYVNAGVFGKVQSGMSVLKAATNTNINNVEITDCGVVVPFDVS